MVTEKELIEFDLLRKVGSRWKYRYSIGANYLLPAVKKVLSNKQHKHSGKLGQVSF